ncbi:MAG: serine/threonine protein kinase [Chloroflexi bacterium]|nr:serine/threonine protein kinase [Chloroflexota bacterium]MCI0579206.1 serine/threonine protein kinase [Chloroflexota bacterium]MCI0649974.1 serine/threonine protein kinase [Chloroflexota bacterium]MCI0725771.1 serine/threonine protein kinase [Chloroflexota bacterium]
MKETRLYKDHYALKEIISTGGFATIYRAVELGRAKDVVLKVGVVHDDPAYAESIRKEAHLLQQFRHRNIVTVYPIPREDRADIYYARAVEMAGHPYFFVMEYLAGGTLEEYLKKVGALAPPEAAIIALEVARALDYVHRQEYAHNDLKLENIVFREPVRPGQPFTPVLIDFGIAMRVSLPDAGSFYIMPPEQVSIAKMQVPPELVAGLDLKKVDVWGLGVVLYRMVGGQLPFAGRNERSLTQRILNSRPTSLRELSPEIPPYLEELIIDGCLAKNPDHRLSLLQLGQELSQLSNGAVAQTVEPRRPKRLWFFGRR